MNALKKYLGGFGIVVVILLAGYAFVEFYSYIFSKTVIGSIENVDRVPLNVGMMVNQNPTDKINPEMFSFAVAIRDSKTNEIMTASSQDRQWAVAEKGKCVEAKFYPYPPWKLDKSGTYFGARLLKMYDCSTAP